MTLATMSNATINHESLISEIELRPHHAPRTSQALPVLLNLLLLLYLFEMEVILYRMSQMFWPSGSDRDNKI